MRGQPGVGSIWTWTAICADTKLMVSWRLGARDAANAHMFISDIADRLANRVQMTTDGNRVYLDAVEHYLGGKVDYAMLVKQYGEEKTPERSYSPAKCLGTKKRKIDGNPDPDFVSTSYAERQNLNIRMGNRRYTRLTNAFSKKADMLAYSVAISFMYHNFCRVHQTLKTTPAVAAGIAKQPGLSRTWWTCCRSCPTTPDRKNPRIRLTHYQSLVSNTLSPDYRGRIQLTRDGLSFRVFRGENLSGEAFETLSILLADIAMLIMGVRRQATHPGLLIHDSPREADLGGQIYRHLLVCISDIAREMASGTTVPFQYIVTTTTPPPPGLRGKNVTRLKLGDEHGQLFGKQLHAGPDAAQAELPLGDDAPRDDSRD
jgi:IS1 family transposase